MKVTSSRRTETVRSKPIGPAYGSSFAAAAAIAALLSLFAPAASAQNGARGSFNLALSASFRFTEQTGEALYANSCQACHMPDGKGATGAGTYPALAGNKNLQAGGYPVSVVINGQRGMPPIGFMMSNEQVAAVVNYVRTHFGNDYDDAVTGEDVKLARP
jgi:mono/diheme cytochrome c family protein